MLYIENCTEQEIITEVNPKEVNLTASKLHSKDKESVLGGKILMYFCFWRKHNYISTLEFKNNLQIKAFNKNYTNKKLQWQQSYLQISDQRLHFWVHTT